MDIQAKHRLIKPRTPQTNHMVERFNGRIAERLKTTCFALSLALAKAIKQYKNCITTLIRESFGLSDAYPSTQGMA